MRPIAALLLVTTCLLAPVAHAEPETIDRIIAVVNDDVLLQSDLDRAMAMAHATIRDRGLTAPPDDVLRGQVMDRLILSRLQTQRAKEAGIHVDDAELNQAIATIAAQNHMTVPEFMARLQTDGMDPAAFRDQVLEQMLVQRVRQKEVDSRVFITEQDVSLLQSNAAADDNSEYQLSHILVAVPEGAGPQDRQKAREKAEGLLKRARGGEDFAQLAIGSSDGQQALNGGDLGWRKLSQLPAAFAAVVPKLAVDQVSDIVETPSGFNIFKLAGHRGGEEAKVVTETHAVHILLQTNTLRDEDATHLQATDLYNRIKGGADIAALAKQFSDDPGSKNVGGDLGWQAPGTFASDFQEQIDKLKPGELSEPFHTRFGWHIAKVLERRSHDVTDEVRRNRAKEAVFERKEAEEYEDWLRRLRGEAYVEMRTGDAAPAGKS
jgi:peptidyl-prolyl cis-trans isomerase SurA